MKENNVHEQEELLCFHFTLFPKISINAFIHLFNCPGCAFAKTKIQQDKLLIFAGIVHNKITAWPRHTNDHNIVITTHNWTSKSVVSHCSD